MAEERSQDGNSAANGSDLPGGKADHTMSCPACSATYPPDTRFCPLDGSTLKPLVNEGDLVGSILDERYYLVEKLGQGGMGEVYLGEHVLTRRQCAVKVVSRTLAADPDGFGRFVREATNAGRISHPHVATIYDFGKTDEGLLYLAMEYVEGEPLATILEREGALAPVRAVEIAQQVAEAVGAAHELGIVHRDLKPGNILVGRDRKGADLVKVVDFGIARATADEQQHLTRTGYVIGTPEYMSPEQLIGDPVDGRADIYALGCILYQMLTGQHAFGGSTARQITRRLTERPPRPREMNTTIPRALDDIVTTALGRTPQDRYQTMEELRAALLAAPSQPVTTGPRRLAAWLGRRGKDRDADAKNEQPPETSTRPSVEAAPAPVVAAIEPAPVANPADTASGAATPAATSPSTPSPAATSRSDTSLSATSLSAASLATSDSAEPASVPAFAESDAADYVTEDGGDALDADAAPAPPRRSLLPKIGVGVAAVGALVLAVALRAPDADPVDVATPTPVDTPAAPLAPPILPDSVLAQSRNELVAADAEIVAEHYVAAIVRLRALAASLDTLAATFPERTDILLVADSTRGQLQRIQRRCNALKKLAAERKEPAPVCEVS